MLLVLHRATAWQWAVASLTVSATAVLISVAAVTVRFGWPRVSFRLFLKHSSEGFGFSFASSTASVYNDIDKTMLSHYGMNLANGIYTMAYRVIDIATIPVTALRDAAVPRLFQRGHAGIAPTAELCYRLLKRALPVSVLVAGAIFVTAPLLPHFLGKSFAESVIALRWLCLLPVFRSVHQMTGSALMGAGLQNYRTTTQLIAAAFNFGANLWLIPHFGWQGAAWSSLATDAALGVMNWGLLNILIAQSARTVPCPPV
jgi:O-antigen/teichoic acid export membrane protein